MSETFRLVQREHNAIGVYEVPIRFYWLLTYEWSEL